MINTAVLVGRLTQDPEIVETNTGKSVCEVTLALTRPFKNANTHTYDSDFIKVTMWESLAINISEYCKKGAIVGVRARIQSRNIKIDNAFVTIPEIVGEQLIFISKGQGNKKELKDEIQMDENIEDIL